MDKLIIILGLIGASITSYSESDIDIYQHDIRYYVDSTDQLSESDVFQIFQNGGGQLLHHYNLNFGIFEHAAWIYIDIAPSEDTKILTIENAHIDTLDIYELNSAGEIKLTCEGDLRNFDRRDIDIHYFNHIIHRDTKEILIRARTEGSLLEPITILPLNEFVNRYRDQELLHFLYFGLMILAFIINLLLFIRFLDWNYLFYILSILALVIVTAVDFGYLFEFLYPNHPGINRFNPVLYMAYIFVVIFTGRFLRIRIRSFIFYLIYWLIIGQGISIIIISLLGYYNLAIKLETYLVMLAPVFIVVSGFYCYFILKIREARFILFGWICTLIAVLIYLLTIYELLPFNFFTGNIIQIGSSFEVTFFFLALIDQVDILRKEKEELLQTQTQNLEKQLQDRAKEIYEINQELIAQNEELLAHQEEVTAQRDLLEKQKRTIENQNVKLKNNQDILERIVTERTEDLSEANKSLADKNERLEQFAHIAAHNLRGPVATLKGLVQLFNKMDYQDPVNREIIPRINDTLEKMDLVIRDLSILLNQHDDLEAMRCPVDLSEILDKTKIALRNEINKNGAIIQDNFPKGVNYNLIPSYINNIFYNLLSNSLIHRAEKKPEIRLELEDLNGKIKFRIIDNGVGINMKKNGSKLFLPYQRFQKNNMGRGIGLFITKSQVDAMNGEIVIHSVDGVGTEVQIILPAL